MYYYRRRIVIRNMQQIKIDQEIQLKNVDFTKKVINFKKVVAY